MAYRSLTALLLMFTINCSLFDKEEDDNSLLLLSAWFLLNSNSCSTSYTAPLTTTTTTGNFTIPDTAQTICYNSSTGASVSCTGAGYDASYNATNQQNYTSTTATVTDTVSGLMWTKSPDTNGDSVVNSSDKKTQSEAVTYCENLNAGGHSDWRLPDIKTLYSLMNFTGVDPSGSSSTDASTAEPFIDDSKFTVGYGDTSSGERFIDGQYATTSLYSHCTNAGNGNSETMFGLNLVDGRIKGYPTSNKTYYVYCVRQNTNYGLNNFTDNGNQTVSDSATGLMWQKNDYQSSGYDNAVSYCENATTASHSDWRLPNVKELQGIVDYSRSPEATGSAAIDPVFNVTAITNEAGLQDYGYYWASTTHKAFQSDGTTVNGFAGTYVCFGRCLGYVNGSIYDVHGAGAQRSNYKEDVSKTPGAKTATGSDGSVFYYWGPQGDILRQNNMVRCVRNI